MPRRGVLVVILVWVLEVFHHQVFHFKVADSLSSLGFVVSFNARHGRRGGGVRVRGLKGGALYWRGVCICVVHGSMGVVIANYSSAQRIINQRGVG